MAKIKATTNPQVRTIINTWKAGAQQADELVYDASDLDGRDIQLWAFKQNVLVDIQDEVGPFKKIVFNAVLS